MKFLEYTPLARLSSFLSRLSFGDQHIHTILEAYSCKGAGADKKLSRSVEQEMLGSLAFSPEELASSPVGPLSSSSCRKTLVYLILTLSHVYPDYDFSMLRSHHFCKVNNFNSVNDAVEQHLADAAKAWEALGEETSLADSLWAAIDEVMHLPECEVYSYLPDDSILHHTSCIWSFAYFFYNRKLKRVLFFSCRCRSNPGLGDDSSSEDGGGDEEFGLAANMDLED